jgi:hypothetical protein
MLTSRDPRSQKRDLGHPIIFGWSDLGHPPCNEVNLLILFTVPMFFGFSERGLVSFERQFLRQKRIIDWMVGRWRL